MTKELDILKKMNILRHLKSNGYEYTLRMYPDFKDYIFTIKDLSYFEIEYLILKEID